MPEPLMPWEQLPDVWKTKAAYFQWLRGQMRKAWSRHPIKNAYTMSRRTRAPVGKKKDKLTGIRQVVWALPCDQCGRTYPQSNVEVDHILRAGSFKDWSDCEQWLMGLMQINFASLQLLCKPCHRIKSYAETHGLSFDEAEVQKKAIAWLKDTAISEQIKVLTFNGYHAVDCTNSKSRRECYVHFLQSKGNK